MVYSYINILKKRNFFLLWFGQVISQFGDRLTQMALIGLVYQLKPGSPLGLAKMLSLAIIPVFLISPVSGVYVDRWNKRKTMYASDFLRAIFISLIPFLFFRLDSHISVHILIFLSFCVGRFFIPAKMAMVPFLVKKEELFLANSLISITAMIAAVLGFGLGGVIVEKWGIKAAFYLDALTFFSSSLLVFLMRVREDARFKPIDIIHVGKDAIVKVKNSFIFEAKEGIRYLFNSDDTRYAAKIFFILFASIGSLYTIIIVFIQKTLSTVTSDLGWLAVAAGTGLFFGSIIYGRIGSKFPLRKSTHVFLFLSSIYLVIFTCILRIYPYGFFAFLSCMFLGILSSPIVVAVNTLIHKESDNNFWGRIFSSLEIVIHLAFIIFMFLASYLAEKISPFTIIISVGIIISLFSLFNLAVENGKSRRA